MDHKTSINSISAVAYKTGQEFKFPDDDKIYVFIGIEYADECPVIHFYDDWLESSREGFLLGDLIRIRPSTT